jgi:hypothetical protein
LHNIKILCPTRRAITRWGVKVAVLFHIMFLQFGERHSK